VYRTLLREGVAWCNLQYIERGGIGVRYSIRRWEGLMYSKFFREGRDLCTLQYLERGGTGAPNNI
jgi:hypothetical protein